MSDKSNSYVLEFKMNERHEYVMSIKHPLLDDQILKVFKPGQGFLAHAYYYLYLPIKLKLMGFNLFGKREFHSGKENENE